MKNILKSIIPLATLVGIFIVMGIVAQFIDTTMSPFQTRISFIIFLLFPIISIFYAAKAINFNESKLLGYFICVVSVLILLMLLIIIGITNISG